MIDNRNGVSLDECVRVSRLTENIVKLVPTLIKKEIDLFSSKVNQNLNGI